MKPHSSRTFPKARGAHPTRRLAAGLTVVEVLVALAMLGVITASVMTSFTSSIRQNADAGKRTQSAQVLNYLGRRVAGGDNLVLATPETPLVWDYGTLASSFSELGRLEGLADSDLYRATVSSVGTLTLGTASAVHYRVEVCSRASGQEVCVQGDTAGPSPAAGDSSGRLPGIN